MKMQYYIIQILLCFSFYSLNAQIIRDNTNPDPPDSVYVSVDPTSMTGGAILYWTPSDSLDVAGYYIFINPEGTGWYVLDTVWGRLTNTYAISSSQAFRYSESYRICAFDFSYNLSIIVPMFGKYSTIYAFPYFDKCNTTTFLDWNSYEGWDTIVYYNIYYKLQNSSYQLLIQIPSTQTSYLHENLLPDIQYCYYVDAINIDGRVSHSNQTCVVTRLPFPPNYLQISNAISANSKITLTVLIDTSSDVKADMLNYKVYRNSNTDTIFYLVKEFSADTISPITFIDSNVIVNMNYCYKVIATDICNREIMTSNIFCITALNVNFMELNNFKIFPNPFKNEIYIETLNTSSYNIEIFNNLSQLVFSSFSNHRELIIEMSNFTQGFYYIKITDNNKMMIKKIIKYD